MTWGERLCYPVTALGLPDSSSRRTSSSAIWIAFSAAPFLRLSDTTHMVKPLG